ncbi:MAG: hypothetical protein VXX85_07765 [Candidatus Margulisiibacteriota bacterium]|nr:hypothetical protein [Candidatus Margulisiibacteriota bacterium]
MNLAEIGLAIDQNNPESFVNTYLICLAHGYSIDCPIDSSLDDLNKKWAKSLAKYRREFSDEFCNEVSVRWLKLLKMCRADEPNIELQLCKAAGLSINQMGEMDPADSQAAKAAQDGIGVLDKTPSSEISLDYREHQLGQAVKLPEFNQLKSERKKAFDSNDSIEFLITHLTFSKYGQEEAIPKSSVHQNIRSAWDDIIADLFNTIPDDLFLEKLTNDWFYLVNQKGIPLDSKEQEELLTIYLAKTKSNRTVVGKKKPSFFKRLFG